MKITLAAIGKQKASPERELVEKYRRQLGWALHLRELEAKKGLSGDTLKTAEAELLLQATADCHRLIALDERGKNLSSPELAQKLKHWQNEGCSHLGVIIGGADGLADIIRQKADLTVSFGKLTWPHMLARAMLTEQLYRAESILRGHPYHRA